jgi:hypothetical protein
MVNRAFFLLNVAFAMTTNETSGRKYHIYKKCTSECGINVKRAPCHLDTTYLQGADKRKGINVWKKT